MARAALFGFNRNSRFRSAKRSGKSVSNSASASPFRPWGRTIFATRTQSSGCSGGSGMAGGSNEFKVQNISNARTGDFASARKLSFVRRVGHVFQNIQRIAVVLLHAHRAQNG